MARIPAWLGAPRSETVGEKIKKIKKILEELIEWLDDYVVELTGSEEALDKLEEIKKLVEEL